MRRRWRRFVTWLRHPRLESPEALDWAVLLQWDRCPKCDGGNFKAPAKPICTGCGWVTPLSLGHIWDLERGPLARLVP